MFTRPPHARPRATATGCLRPLVSTRSDSDQMRRTENDEGAAPGGDPRRPLKEAIIRAAAMVGWLVSRTAASEEPKDTALCRSSVITAAVTES